MRCSTSKKLLEKSCDRKRAVSLDYMRPSFARKASRPVRILLADDHDVIRKGLRALLESQEDWRICAEAATGEEAVKFATELKPRIVVLDLQMAGLDGLEATRQIKKKSPRSDIVIFTMHDAEYLIREVLFAGARAFVLKTEGGTKLIEAIQAILRKKPFFADRASESLLNSFLKSPRYPLQNSVLTRREREVVHLLSSGKSNKEAASELGLSVKTVETHRAAIMRKLGLRSVAEMVRYAVREHIIKP
jgi:DNA-binding NarL/FixJ family response regulator